MTHPLLRGKRKWTEKLIESGIHVSAYLAIAVLILIFIFVGKEAIPIFTSAEVHEEVDLDRLILPQPESGFSWQPVSEVPKYSLLPLFIGTLKVAMMALLIAIPLALGAAIFTSEFAPSGIREVIKPVVELLAGLPSVVVGFFCLIVLASWVQDAFGLIIRLNAVTAGIGVALAVIPIIYTVSEDALSAVPQSYRDASLALGANTWQTAWRVVLPAALPGIFAACVLGFGRAIGETMIVRMIGNTATMSLDPTKGYQTFSATIATEMGELVPGSPHYHVLFFIGAFLFLFTFTINLAGHWYIGRLRSKLSGKAAAR